MRYCKKFHRLQAQDFAVYAANIESDSKREKNTIKHTKHEYSDKKYFQKHDFTSMEEAIMFPVTTFGQGRKAVARLMAFIMFWMSFSAIAALAQPQWQFSLQQRRMHDQIHVEVWAKARDTNVARIGEASLMVQYNADALQAANSAPLQTISVTDSVSTNLDQSNPIIAISSVITSAAGYQPLANTSYGISGSVGYLALEIKRSSFDSLGFTPIDTGRGAFLGKLIFDIKPGANDPVNPDTTLLTGVQFGQSALPPGNVIVIASTGDTLVGNVNGNPANATFALQPDFTVVGISLLNPQIPNQVVDRDKPYVSTVRAVTGTSANVTNGYPLYFERSGYFITSGATRANRYLVEYSRDGGSSWLAMGRIAEGTVSTANIANVVVGANSNIISTYATVGNTGVGSILFAASGTTWPNAVTFQTVSVTQNRSILRVVLATRADYQFRSENARFRISRLQADTTIALDQAAVRTQRDTSASFILGRLFFLQLNGLNEYARTDSVFSNATQLTAEAWVNLNQDYGTASSPGIIASSPGTNSETGEGTWMLYLHQGRFPAFRAREILGRGDGYVATVISQEPLEVVNSTTLASAHQNNWVHIAATVSNDTVSLYVNGELMERKVNPFVADARMGVNGNPGTFPIWVGVNPNVTTAGATIPVNQYFPGGIKEARVWRVALPQDSLRRNIPGVSQPTNVGANNVTNFRKGLELYFSLEGSNRDAASNTTFQRGTATAVFNRNGQAIGEAFMPFRPDLPHLRLTAPKGCEGISNARDSVFSVRWVGFGLTNAFITTSDVSLEYSVNGANYFPALSANAANAHIANLETTTAPWIVSLSSTLANINPYSFTNARLRIRGNTLADTLYSFTSDVFAIAPHFSLRRGTNATLKIADGSRFVMSGQEMFLEAWIRPYRFPATGQTLPILTKADSTTGEVYFSLDLLDNGRLRFAIRGADGVLRTATSSDSLRHRVVRPNTIALDSPWTHVGVYVNRGSATQTTKILFYTDGNPHTDTAITNQLRTFFETDNIDGRPVYIGSRPAVVTTTGTVTSASVGFEGDIREVRFWSGRPNGSAVTGSEPTEMTNYIRGALALRSRSITNKSNLIAGFSLDGGGFSDPQGYYYSFQGTTLAGEPVSRARFLYNNDICFVATQPFIKVVEPSFQQRISMSATAVTVRWVGFDYVTTATRTVSSTFATTIVTSPIEISFLGGGGNVVQPYSHITNATTGPQAFSLASGAAYRFPHTSVGTGVGLQFAGVLNPSIANPFSSGQSVLGTLTNARIRYLVTTATIAFNGSAIDSISSEGPLFTIVPPSNFTVRALLEGYHVGNATTQTIAANLGTTYNTGGVRIKLYRDNNGQRGSLIDSSVSENGYYNFASGNAVRLASTRHLEFSTFANIPFVFTNIPDGNYWVVVEHRNHLPVMSRFAANFHFSGDDIRTANIESGWDFTTWGGTTATTFVTALGFPQLSQPTSFGNSGNNWLAQGLYSAFGDFVTTSTLNPQAFSRTGLIFNSGRTGALLGQIGGLPALVAGDVDRGSESNNVINAFDRQKVRRDAGTTNFESDVTGDDIVNGTDRDIVDRNTGRVSSLLLENFLGEAAEGEESVAIQQVLQFEQERFGSEIGTKPVSLSQKFDNNVEGELTATGVSFDIMAEPVKEGVFVSVPVYIRNTGTGFGMGHATFAVKYDNTVLAFAGLAQQGQIFTSGAGYLPMQFTPSPEAINQVPGVASIEVVYDRVNSPVVANVPSAKTLIGTLRFQILNDKAPVVLEWENSTVVHRTNGEMLTGVFDFRTGSGNFMPIRPLLTYSVDVTAPACRATVSAGSKTPITWVNKGANTLHIEYSSDNGQAWTRINTQPIAASAQTFAWDVPNTPSTLYFVRLLDAITGLELDRTDCAFTVVPPTGAFTSPAAGAVLRCNTTEVIRWNAQAVNLVRLEFFDGFRWSVIAASVNASTGSFIWRVPDAITTVAKIRMINIADNSVIGTSQDFSVLCGTLDFIKPTANQITEVGEVLTIEWFADAVQTVDLQFSPNNGATWQTIMTNVNAALRRALWIPTQPTNLAVLRAIAPGTPSFVYSVSPRFRINNATSVADNSNAEYVFEKPAPNPASSVVHQHFTLAKPDVISIKVYSIAGEQVFTLADQVSYQEGRYSLSFSVEGLASGVYYIQYTTSKGQFTNTLFIQK